MDRQEKCAYFKNLLEQVEKEKGLSAKALLLEKTSFFQAAIQLFPFLQNVLSEETYSLKAFLATGQAEIVFSEQFEKEPFQSFCTYLDQLESFYHPIGGIIGYHYKVLSLMEEKEKSEDLDFLPPPYYDIREETEKVCDGVLHGIKSLEHIGELYVVGGAGDRLSLVDPVSGKPLPVAKLAFEGRTLLETLLRDIEAREYLFYKLFHRSITTPIVLMTSIEKNNDAEIKKMLEESNFLGRGESNFKRVLQPVVPLIATDGNWVVAKPSHIVTKPGGHGVVWKLLEDENAFEWLQGRKREGLIVRQINNPAAGQDYGLLALSGFSMKEEKSFGFNGCPQRHNAPEGMNVIKEKSGESFLTNLEYTEFKKHAAKNLDIEKFPANTNILFVRIDVIRQTLKQLPFPGMIINLKLEIPTLRKGEVVKLPAARLETTMQNMADVIPADKSVLLYNKRSKTISVAKKSLSSKNVIEDTPQGAFYDLLVERKALLEERLGFKVPEMPQKADFVEQGPSFLFSYNPALGPLYSVIEQKIQGGAFSDRAELDLEIADASIRNLTVDGSFLLEAKVATRKKNGFGEEALSDKVGRALFHNVTVFNKGIDREKTKDYWNKDITRQEVFQVILEGNSECVAQDVTIKGNMQIVVPDGVRVILYQEGDECKARFESLDKEGPLWNYSLEEQRIKLEYSNTL